MGMTKNLVGLLPLPGIVSPPSHHFLRPFSPIGDVLRTRLFLDAVDKSGRSSGYSKCKGGISFRELAMSNKNYAWVVAVLLAVFGFAGRAAFAQTSSGQIAGRVIDPDAAVVVGAQVTLTNQDTSVRWTAQTDSSGLFAFPALQPGIYSISVEATGFKDLKKRDLHLSASERLSAGDLKLEVGAVTETVTVTAAGTAVQTQSAERSALLDSNEMQHLSTPGRDTLALVR